MCRGSRAGTRCISDGRRARIDRELAAGWSRAETAAALGAQGRVAYLPAMIRPTTRDDAPALLAVWRAAVEATHHFLTPADIDAIEVEVRGYLASEAELWLAERDGRPVGFMGLDGTEVVALFVDPAVHRGGVGRSLLSFAIERGADHLQVNEQNPGAAAFYERLGFVACERSPVDSAGRPFPLVTMRRRPADALA